MPTQSPLSIELREHYEAESARLQSDFSATKDGLKYLRDKSALVDSIACRLWAQFCRLRGSSELSQIAFAAVGDFGRRTLFPYSDVDLVFLAATSEAAEKFKDAIPKCLARG